MESGKASQGTGVPFVLFRLREYRSKDLYSRVLLRRNAGSGIGFGVESNKRRDDSVFAGSQVAEACFEILPFGRWAVLYRFFP